MLLLDLLLLLSLESSAALLCGLVCTNNLIQQSDCGESMHARTPRFSAGSCTQA